MEFLNQDDFRYLRKMSVALICTEGVGILYILYMSPTKKVLPILAYRHMFLVVNLSRDRVFACFFLTFLLLEFVRLTNFTALCFTSEACIM